MSKDTQPFLSDIKTLRERARANSMRAPSAAPMSAM